MNGAYQIRDDLKSEIRERGLTIAEVARSAGLSYACLSAMLNGRSNPSPRVKRAVASVLGEPVDSIFPSECTTLSTSRPERTSEHRAGRSERRPATKEEMKACLE